MEPALTYGNCHDLLRLNGFAPVPIGHDSGQPLGPVFVLQVDWSRHDASENAAPAVLTTCPPLRSPAPAGSPLINDHRATHLAVVAVKAHADLWPAIDAIVGNGPVRVAEDGRRLYVFALDGDPFGAFSTATWGDAEWSAQAKGANEFIPLTGEWQRGSLLETRRSDLPTLNAQRAQAMIDALDVLLADSTPAPVPVFTRHTPQPLPDLTRGDRLEFGHKRAVAQLEANGYDPCPVAWGESRPSDRWFADYMNRICWSDETKAHGVGVFANLSAQQRDRALCTVEITGRPDLVALADAALSKRLGTGPVRVSSDGTLLRLFRASSSELPRAHDFQLSPPGAYTAGGFVRLRIVPPGGVIVLSGLDDVRGKPYAWPEGSPLTMPRDQLPALGETNVEWVKRDVEAALVPAPEAVAAPKRARRA